MPERKLLPGWAWWTLAATAAMLGVYLHARQCVMLPSYDPFDDTSYFQTESAVQYRYARMLSQGGEVPASDTKAQFPEGLKTGREISLLMERATALTSRVLFAVPPVPYHTFVILWVCALSGLSVLACWLLGRELSGESPPALAAALLFAACWVGSTLTTEAYGFQTFALPLMFFAVAAFCASLSRERVRARLWAAAGAAAFAAALASWHFARFFLISLWLAFGWAAWRARADEAALPRLRLCAAWLLGFCAAAGLLSGSLRATYFVLSPAFLLGAALLAALTLKGRRLAAALLGCAALAAWQAGSEAAGFGHVYALLRDKLRFALAKPADPLLLSGEARLLWQGPFNSPPAGFLVFSFLPLAFAAVPRLWRAFRGEPVKDPAGAFCDALLVLYAIGTLLVRRLAPLLGFFLCVASLRRGGASRRNLLAAGLAALALLEGLKTVAPHSPLNLVMPLAAAFPSAGGEADASVAGQRAMLEWLRKNGGGRPVAADFGVSAAVLAYTDSPVLLHPKFESKAVRAKTAEFLKALYSDEEAFYAFCAKYGAGLFLYRAADTLDGGPDGSRYMAGAAGLKESMAAVRFHFFPEKLKRFRLLYENGDYRIFEIGKAGKIPLSARPVYDLALYDPKRSPDGGLVIDTSAVFRRMRENDEKQMLASIYLRLGKPEKALALYDEAFAIWPPEPERKAAVEKLRASLTPPAKKVPAKK